MRNQIKRQSPQILTLAVSTSRALANSCKFWKHTHAVISSAGGIGSVSTSYVARILRKTWHDCSYLVHAYIYTHIRTHTHTHHDPSCRLNVVVSIKSTQKSVFRLLWHDAGRDNVTIPSSFHLQGSTRMSYTRVYVYLPDPFVRSW